MDDYIVRVIDLPVGVRGFVLYDSDCTANIYISAGMSREEQRKTLKHELRHVQRNDCFRPATIDEVEG